MEVNKRPPSTIRLFILLMIVSFGCIGSVLVAADLQCSSDIEAWVPLYPDGETISVEYDFVRPRAMGETILIQHSSDDIEVIKQFYRDNVIKILDEGRTRGLAVTEWQVEPDEESDTNHIILFSSCGI